MSLANWRLAESKIALRQVLVNLALFACCCGVFVDARARYKIANLDTYAVGHHVNISGMLTSTGPRSPGGRVICTALRYESNDCAISKENLPEWRKFASALAAEGCDVVEMSSGPEDARIRPDDTGFAGINAVSLVTASTLRLAGLLPLFSWTRKIVLFGRMWVPSQRRRYKKRRLLFIAPYGWHFSGLPRHIGCPFHRDLRSLPILNRRSRL